MCFLEHLQHHVLCDSHLRSHAYIVFLDTSPSLMQALFCLVDVMSHLQTKTFSRWPHTADLAWTIWNRCVGRDPALGIAGPARRHLAISIERSTHAIFQKLSFGNGSMRKERNSSRDRSKNSRNVLSSQHLLETNFRREERPFGSRHPPRVRRVNGR